MKEIQDLGVKVAPATVINPQKFRPKRAKRGLLAEKVHAAKLFFRDLPSVNVQNMSEIEYREHLKECFVQLSTCLAHHENLVFDNLDNPFEQ